MDWTYLGHASWLAVADGLRLLFDPILADPHQGGTYAVWPPRRVAAEALRPDFLFISHAHPDHFDVRSMARLARLDPETVVITPDPLVVEVARRLGFRTVHEQGAGDAIDLDGPRIVLTPSRAPDPEWGAVVSTGEGVVWNQVDTVLADREEVRRVVGASSGGRGIDLALVRWAPLLEIDAQVPGALEFPLVAYDTLLGQIDAIGARALVPAAAGQRHVTARWLDDVVLPVSPERALVDLAVRCAPTRCLSPAVGGVYRLRGGETTLDPAGGHELATPLPAGPDPRRFRPLAVPDVTDMAPKAREAELRMRIAQWVEGPLADALGAAWPVMKIDDDARLGLEVVFPSGTTAWTFVVGPHRVAVRREPAGELDVLDVVAASALDDVLSGRRAWGHVLLAGELRAVHRAYRASPGGLRRARIAPVFLYYALPYAESARRTVLAELDAVLTGRPAPWLDGDDTSTSS